METLEEILIEGSVYPELFESRLQQVESEIRRRGLNISVDRLYSDPAYYQQVVAMLQKQHRQRLHQDPISTLHKTLQSGSPVQVVDDLQELGFSANLASALLSDPVYRERILALTAA